jgi:hypothetical protein
MCNVVQTGELKRQPVDTGNTLEVSRRPHHQPWVQVSTWTSPVHEGTHSSHLPARKKPRMTIIIKNGTQTYKLINERKS